MYGIFYNSQFKKYNCNSTDSYKRKIWLDYLSYIIFLCVPLYFYAHMEVRLPDGISLDYAGIPPNTCQVDHLARWDRVFFGQFYFCKILIKNMRTFAWMNESNLCPNVFIKALCHCLLYKKLKNLKPLKTTWLKHLLPTTWQTFWLKWERRLHMNVR